jgi:hypothetical protein
MNFLFYFLQLANKEEKRGKKEEKNCSSPKP